MNQADASGIMATLRHARQAGLCASGVRRWFAPHGRDRLRAFCREGLPVEWLEAQPDAYAVKVAALARAEARADG